MADIINLTTVRKGKTKTKLFKRLLLLVIMTTIIVASLVNKDAIENMGILDFLEEKLFGFNTNPGFPVEYMGGNGNDIYAVNDGILLTTDTYLLTYNPKGSLSNYTQHSFYNLRVETYKNNQLIYDRGGKDICIYRNAEKVNSKTLTDQISTAVYSSDGKVAVLTDSGSFATKLTVFNSSLSKELFVWYNTEYQAFDVAFSDNNKDLAVACYGVSDGRMISKVFLFNLESDEVIAEVTLANTMVISLKYMNNASLMIIGDDQTVVADNSGNTDATYNYSGKTLSFYDNSSEEYAMLIFEPTNKENSSQLIILDKEAEEEFTGTINEKIRDVSLTNKIAAVLTEHSVFYYTISEKSLNRLETESDGYKVLLKNQDVYVLGFSQIKKLSPN